MSRKCEQCGNHIRSYFTHTTPTLRQDVDKGLTYRFCSEACANLWTARREAVPPPSPQAVRKEEDRQADQRWLAEGGGMGPAS